MIYLDNAASTRVSPAAQKAAGAAMEAIYANPSSLHSAGFEAERLVEGARASVSRALGAKSSAVFFTPGGTYAANAAVLGAARANARQGRHIVASAIEHAAVHNALLQLEKEGFEVALVPPEGNGRVSAEKFLGALRSDTVLACLMLVNSETGLLQPVARVGRELGLLPGRRKPLLFCDAVQGFLKLPFSPDTLGADLLCVSGHKVHAPKGVGALYVRPGTRLAPLVFGGGQEGGYSPGTEPVPSIAAFGAAAGEGRDGACLERLKALALELLKAAVPGLTVVSPGDVAGMFTVSLPGYKGETLVHFLAERGILVSAGSACGRGKPSRVLSAMGVDRRVADGAIRVSMSHENTEGDVRALAEALSAALRLAHT